MEFTKDWFTHNIPTWSALLSKTNPRRVLEVGSHEGRSACWLIENCPLLISLYCVDVWRDVAIEKRFDANTAAALVGKDVHVVKCKGLSALKLSELAAIAPGSFDFIYIDGSHTAPDTLTDAVLAFQLLKVGGLLIFDDYLWFEDGHANPLLSPKIGIDAFVNIFAAQVTVLMGTPLYQLYLQKVSE